MDFRQESPSKLGFSLGHIGIIAGCLVVLSFFALLKNDFHLPRWHIFSQAAPAAEKKLTYEEVRNKLASQASVANGSSESLSDTLATVDSSFAGGSVLGASTAEL